MTSIETIAVPGPGKTEREETGLHSPPETNMKDTSDSELSDLEPEIETQEPAELGDLQPDHYSPDGSVPVFKPSMEEFKDFQRYMRGVQSYGMRHGIIKVIPPAEWLANQPSLDEIIKTIRIKEPIKQDIMGTSGTYRQANILHQRSYNLPQWRQLCDQSEHQPPAKRGERRANQDKPMKPTPKPKSKGSSKKKGPGRPFKSKSKAAALDSREGTSGTSTPDRLPTPDSPSMKPEEDTGYVKHEELGDDECPGKPKGGRQPKAISVSSRRKFNRREAAAKVDEEAFKDFNHQLEGVDYSQERCDELERAYWKTLTYAPPLYGADMMGSLFDDRTTTWNLGKLENLLDVLGTKIPGVNTAYLYLGMWKATFAWHLEDVDLYSINYLHFGAPKQWYSISQGDARRFEAAMKTIWPTDAKACDQFLRHKTFLISPSHLMQNFNIKVNKIVHHPGEFVITFPYGYHSGYNLGYNCAEAVNFALESWLEYGRVAKKCDCSEAQDSVWIDVPAIERKLRGEETEYETEDEDEDEEDEEENETSNMPTPPGSTDTKIKAPQKKRKRPTSDKVDNSNVKRIRVRIKAPLREPCVLCPNDIPSEPLLPTEDGQKAHRMCAMYIPETSIDDGEKEIVNDVKYIDKARLDLKCNYCRSKKGACFQCSYKKCTRAYHATCAAAAGVLVEQGEIPVFGEDGTEYKEWGIEFSCRFHRIKRDKKLDGEALGDNERILKAASFLKVGGVCQMQYFKGDIFAGAVVENRKSEEMLLLDILPRGERVEVEYKWLLIPDPADYRLAKPSANAIPMPKSHKDKQSLNTTKRQADDLPRADDIFVKGFTWFEFNHYKVPRNTFQVKIDFKRENQIWHYLGKNSTEAKAQFTEDPAKPRHNPKGHFLDTIPKVVPVVPRQSYAASYPSTVNQNTISASKALSRPAQPTNSSAKPEKPYVYKPRNTTNGDMYRVDPQAYRSQQTFLQQSQQSQQSQPLQQSQLPAPYSFGTDPRWRQPESKSPATYTGQSSPVTSLSPATVGAVAPPQSQYRAPFTSTYTPAYTPPPKQNNPFNGRSQSTKPNPFAKYSYLQKEHNRSPLEYKTPYRPGGGFMNGYQGNMAEHWKKTLFQNRPTSSTPLSNSLPSYGSIPRPSYSPSQLSPTPYKPGTSYSLPNPQHQPTPPPAPHPTTNVVPPNAWERKDSSQLHPAIRQEYGTMFHNQYQPPQCPSPQQYQGPVMQPPAMYDRQASQLHAPYPSAHSQHHHTGQQHYNHSPHATQVPNTQQYSQVHPSSHILEPQQPHQANLPPRGPEHLQQHHASQVIPPVAYQLSNSPVYQPQVPFSPQAQYQENQPVYAHQQFFQKTQPQGSFQHHRDFPDVPADSTSLIEKMMLALRKAT